MPTAHPFAIVDAFTTGRAFSGNPAGVLIMDDWADIEWMQGVANELNQAETAFLVPDGNDTYALRWFTPVAEVSLCGHATLAAAHWLWESERLRSTAPAAFKTRSGQLTAVQAHKAIRLDFPAVPATRVEPTPGLAAVLAGTDPVWTGITENPEPKERNLLVVLPTELAVRDLMPNLASLEQLPVGGLIVTARRAAGGVVSRYFAPAYGIPEDPVTGSAHCTIGCYWADKLGSTLFAEQASPRGGHLTVETTDSGRVLLSGTAHTSATGLLS